MNPNSTLVRGRCTRRLPTGEITDIHLRADAIRCWLLGDSAQLSGGEHDGGVLGYVDAVCDRWFVYPEIVGYYLTGLAFMAAEDPGLHTQTVERARRALGWLARRSSWTTRDYVHRSNGADWRNSAMFTFDLGMLLAGVGHWTQDESTATEARLLEARVVAELKQIPTVQRLLGPLRPTVDIGHSPLPQRWSTRPGPHLVKVAAIILRSDNLHRSELSDAAARSVQHWKHFVAANNGAMQVHPVLYFVEGLIFAAISNSRSAITTHAHDVLFRILSDQTEEGDLPEQINPRGGLSRADITAQALRICSIAIGADQRKFGPMLQQHAHRLYTSLIEHYLSNDGGVLGFRRSIGINNPSSVWATIFTYQALRLYGIVSEGTEIPRTLLQRIA